MLMPTATMIFCRSPIFSTTRNSRSARMIRIWGEMRVRGVGDHGTTRGRDHVKTYSSAEEGTCTIRMRC
jgi:hypothetical protein